MAALQVETWLAESGITQKLQGFVAKVPHPGDEDMVTIHTDPEVTPIHFPR